MSARRVPGDIPELLRVASLVVLVQPIDRDVPVGSPGVVVQVLPDGVFIVAFRWTEDPAEVGCEAFAEVDGADLALDLPDPTGRAHAQWWAWARIAEIVTANAWHSPLYTWCEAQRVEWNDVWLVVYHHPHDDAWWTPERIALLAEVVLRLAGRWT